MPRHCCSEQKIPNKELILSVEPNFLIICILALVFSCFKVTKRLTIVYAGEMMESKRKSEVYLEKIAKDITDNFLKLSKPDNGKTIILIISLS